MSGHEDYRRRWLDPESVKALRAAAVRCEASSQAVGVAAPRPNLVRLAGPFPRATDPAVEARIARFECLTRPMALASLPDEQALRALGATMPRFAKLIEFIGDRVAFASMVAATHVRL